MSLDSRSYSPTPPPPGSRRQTASIGNVLKIRTLKVGMLATHMLTQPIHSRAVSQA